MGFNLLFPFDSDNPEFARGFEAGCLWEKIKTDHTTWDRMIHATNSEMVMRMAEAENRGFRAEIVSDEWVNVFIS